MAIGLRLPEPGGPESERFLFNLSWLLRLRWLAVIGQLLTIFGADRFLGLEMPLDRLLPIILLGAVTNAALALSRRTRLFGETVRKHGEGVLGSILVLDIILLSGLLYVSGGTANPFSIFYLVNIALASTLLKPAWAWALNSLAVACFVSLFFYNDPLPSLREPIPVPGRREADYTSVGLLVAVAGAATILVYFVTRVKAELAHRESQLALERQRQARTERFEALATLAGGAAHELATPLSTIAVISRELELQLDRQGPIESAIEDARLIRHEVDRCRAILDQMSFDAGESVGEGLVRADVRTLLDWAVQPLVEAARVDVVLDEETAAIEIEVPKRAAARTVRSVVKNGLDASSPSERVRVDVAVEGRDVVITVVDRGVGMDPRTIAQASDPFFTTKQPGSGMGLGLFLARSVIDRLGGELEFDSVPGKGTTVLMRLPVVRQPDPSDGEFV